MITKLMKLGFSEGEARVYVAALELGETSIANIAKKSNVERTSVYGFTESLRKRGLMAVSKRGKRAVYVAGDPKRLRGEVKEREHMVEKVLPELLSITNLITNKPRVRFFDSKEGIYDIYRETLEFPDSRILIWMSNPWFDNARFWTDYYLPMRLEKKVFMRAIMPKDADSESFAKDNQKSLRDTRMTDESDISADIMLYGTRSVAIVSYQESTAIVLESKQLYDTLRGIFEAHWHLLSLV
jgi:HTH-type transcriptional regulator, sugar sensing transcriptional regulator